MLMWKMFINGLPGRAALTIGDMYISQNCLAGCQLAKAFQLSKAQNWSGCVLSEEAANALINTPTTKSHMGQHIRTLIDRRILPYPVQFKTETRNRLCLDWVYYYRKIENIGNWIVNAFEMHNKTVGPKELEKARLTESFVNYLYKGLDWL